MDTQSRCEELQSELARSHQERGELINKCVNLHKQRVEEAAGDREAMGQLGECLGKREKTPHDISLIAKP